MKAVILAFGILAFGLALAAGSARADAIAPSQATAHVGQTVTVEGTVNDVFATRSGVTFLDIGGTYPNNAFAVVIFKDDASKFPDTDSLSGKTVDVSGTIRLYRGKPEIVLSDPGQLKTK